MRREQPFPTLSLIEIVVDQDRETPHYLDPINYSATEELLL